MKDSSTPSTTPTTPAATAALSSEDLLALKLAREQLAHGSTRIVAARSGIAVGQLQAQLGQFQAQSAAKDLQAAEAAQKHANASLQELDQTLRTRYGLKPDDEIDMATGALVRKGAPAAP